MVLAPTRDVKESLRKTYNEGLKRGKVHEAVRLGATLKQKEKDRIKVISLVLAPTRDVEKGLS